ncbi:MAG: ATP-binding cassette domain-containing protein [Lachnospiraceae bacterium]|nr:ATP-binding cassette domain-containing protein [Lachnospiraceae bacterium]
METAIKIQNLNKSFGKKHIIKDLSMELKAGEVFGFLGPNGAGKTTTIKMIVGMLHLESGSIEVCGVDVEKDFEKAMANIGAIVENPEMYKYLTGMDNLKQYARMRKGVTKERIDEVVELVGLSNRINEKVKKYSLGMRQRLGVAQAILHKPKVLILDEPSNGLDPAGIKQLRDILKNLAHNEGVCVLVSSHLMSEMELMCDRVGIIAEGKLLDIKTIDDMTRAVTADVNVIAYHVTDASKAKEIVDEYVAALDIDEESKTIYKFNVQDNEHFDVEFPVQIVDELWKLNKKLAMADVGLISICPQENRKLEDVFIEMTANGGDQIA